MIGVVPRPMTRRWLVAVLVAAICLTLLGIVPPAAALAVPPDATRDVGGTPTASVKPVAAVRPAAGSYHLEARYDVDLHLDWDSRRLDVRTRIALRNTSGGSVDRLWLNTIAARLGSMRGLRVRVDGERVPASIKGQTIKVPLGKELAPDAEAAVFVGYRARLRTSTAGRDFLFTKSNGIAHLYRFIPWLSRRIAFGSQGHGEPFLTPESPWVRVEASSDRRLVWATTGRRIAREGRIFTFQATGVRDFNLTASPRYRTAAGQSKDRQTRIVAHTITTNGRRLVRLARDELARFERITGLPYPHDTYRIAESGAGLAMEAPGLIWIPGARSASDQPFLVSHETAHQWFYGIVGNDQSTNAFADEALADYYARKAHLSLRPSRCRSDRLDRDIRAYSRTCYFEVIYVQGARFLDGLRRDFGTKKFKRAVRKYVQANRSGIGSNKKLLEAFRAEMGDGVLKRYRKRFPSLY